MVGKKKGSFYLYMKPFDNDGVNRVEKRDGWVKDGVGYCKNDFGNWTITDIQSGRAISQSSYSTLDAAEAEVKKKEELIVAKKTEQAYLDVKEDFDKLVKEAKKTK